MSVHACAWLSDVVAATVSIVVFNRNLALRGNLRIEMWIVHDSASVCRMKRLTCKYACLETARPDPGIFEGWGSPLAVIYSITSFFFSNEII